MDGLILSSASRVFAKRLLEMGTASGRQRVFATLLSLVIWITTTRAFLEIPFNKDQHFGPDGPWQAVTFGIKYTSDSDFKQVSVYPAVMYNSIAALYLPTKQACKDDTTGKCGVGGTIGTTYNNGSWWYTYENDQTGYYFRLNGTQAYTDIQLPNNIIMSSAITDVLRIGDMTYPSGITLPIELGYGCLGGSPLAQVYNAPLSLWNSGNTQSNSYGLHIGAVGLNYPGSLVFGGYDRGRVIGPVINYDAYGELALIDVEIGVETGESPFNFDMQSNLMKIPQTGEFTGSLPTLVKPEYPYIYVNQETLDAVTSLLPVKFSQSAGFYLWDTQDPSYKQIINSPAYLGFVFPSETGNTANMTVKVPFKLLNLTLEKSASGLSSDVPYLPLMATELGTDLSLDILLGRAFLQSAFIGTNWNTNTSWLAQAPGPGSGDGLGYSPVDVMNKMTTLDAREGGTLFADSWSSHWTPISKSTSGGGGNNGGNDGGSGGISGGAIAGIVVGAVVIIAVIAFIVFFLVRRKRKARKSAADGNASPSAQPFYADKPQGYYGDGQQPYYSDQSHELQSNAFDRNELDGQGHYKPGYKPGGYPQEMPGQGYASELPGHGYQQQPHELPAHARSM